MNGDSQRDERIREYIEATERFRQGDYALSIPTEPSDEIGQLGQSLAKLGYSLELRRQELQKLDEITARINAGLLLDDILENVYADFREIIPYNRIGFSLIQNNGKVVRARWAKSDQPEVYLDKGYAAWLEEVPANHYRSPEPRGM
jgi:hypothetical protein